MGPHRGHPTGSDLQATPYNQSMLFAFSISPVATDSPDGAVGHVVARAVKVIQDSGLPQQTDSMFTTVEGEWDEVMPVIKQACDAILEVSPRVSLVLKADLRPGQEDALHQKVQRLNLEIGKLEETSE